MKSSAERVKTAGARSALPAINCSVLTRQRPATNRNENRKRRPGVKVKLVPVPKFVLTTSSLVYQVVLLLG
jgi:hypothetical protein